MAAVNRDRDSPAVIPGPESDVERAARFGEPVGGCLIGHHSWRSGGFEFVEYSDAPEPGTIVNDMLSICETCNVKY